MSRGIFFYVLKWLSYTDRGMYINLLRKGTQQSKIQKHKVPQRGRVMSVWGESYTKFQSIQLVSVLCLPSACCVYWILKDLRFKMVHKGGETEKVNAQVTKTSSLTGIKKKNHSRVSVSKCEWAHHETVPWPLRTAKVTLKPAWKYEHIVTMYLMDPASITFLWKQFETRNWEMKHKQTKYEVAALKMESLIVFATAVWISVMRLFILI